MAPIGKTIQNTASKIGAGLGLDTRASRVAETKRLAKDFRRHMEPTDAVASAKASVKKIRKVSDVELQARRDLAAIGENAGRAVTKNKLVPLDKQGVARNLGNMTD